MKKCLWSDYICMLEEEITKLMEHEVHCHLSSRGEADLHHMMENLKHAKMFAEGKGVMPAASGSPEKSSYFGG